MEDLLAILPPEEVISIKLRNLYAREGFQFYKLSSFEEYDYFLENRSFLSADEVITFTGNDGRLMALKPDVTLAIVKNTAAGEERKVYYNEDVYRHSRESGEYKRIHQIGLEVLGKIQRTTQADVVGLALKSLEVAGAGSLDLSHMQLAECFLNVFEDQNQKEAARSALQRKSPHEMDKVAKLAGLSEEWRERLNQLCQLSGEINEALRQLEKLAAGLPDAQKPLAELAAINEHFSDKCKNVSLRIDLAILNDIDYYNGLIFQGFLEGLPEAVLYGGRYDRLLEKNGNPEGAIGFAMYLNDLNELDHAPEAATENKEEWLNVALPKGRMGDKVYECFKDAGIVSDGIFDDSRKLIFEDPLQKIRFFLVKPSDVDSYVDHGAADIGVAGKDVLLESDAQVLELLDLAFGKCWLAVAGKKDFAADPAKSLKVATKYPNITRAYYAEQSQAVELIHLHGSIELAPLLELSDVIVDIVETGTTLKENGLTILQKIEPSSARLICNQASWRFKNERISALVEKVRQTI